MFGDNAAIEGEKQILKEYLRAARIFANGHSSILEFADTTIKTAQSLTAYRPSRLLNLAFRTSLANLEYGWNLAAAAAKANPNIAENILSSDLYCKDITDFFRRSMYHRAQQLGIPEGTPKIMDDVRVRILEINRARSSLSIAD